MGRDNADRAVVMCMPVLMVMEAQLLPTKRNRAASIMASCFFMKSAFYMMCPDPVNSNNSCPEKNIGVEKE